MTALYGRERKPGGACSGGDFAVPPRAVFALAAALSSGHQLARAKALLFFSPTASFLDGLKGGKAQGVPAAERS